ncbi:uncharacterized protein MEPE_03937 [Melanopsichium pennsylvanicum]|uniref:DNA polymerase delta subunit 3 n=2 Tax=Melanopsichium pennsylvanicum TaxID=63383 RepID=A0AAJ5C652_9BASI|nr:dna polymerase subunit cdc27 protein [Melanopsichium pennsylvanicum 4]SNX85228.1 uncharacterized protein MEPE_03937 [Melanopsichium pennsylvanicum]
MPSISEPTSFLTSWLQRDKKLITYRLLSRELRIHVDEAKKALASFFESHKDKSDLDATYILIGRSAATKAAETINEKPDQDKLSGPSPTPSSPAPIRSFLESRITQRQSGADVIRQVIRLVSAHQLDEARASLTDISSCHIYSLSPGKLRDALQLTAVQHDLHTQQKYIDAWQQTNRGADLGVIVNSNIKDNYDPSRAIPSLGAPSAPAIPVSKNTKPTKNNAAKSEVKVEQGTKPSAKSTPSASAGGKKGGLIWSKAKPKEIEPKTTAKEEAFASNKRGSARKALLGSDDEDENEGRNGRKSVPVDDDDDDDDDKPEELGYADDGSDDGNVKMDNPMRQAAARGTGKRADARSQTKTQEAAQRKELEAMMESDDDELHIVEPSGTADAKKTSQGKDLDPDVDMADSTITYTMKGSEALPAAPKRRVRKKRKIGSKKIRTKDERGYTVTKTVDEYESYSSEESDAPVVVGSKRGAGAFKSQSKQQSESRSHSTSASASPAPTAPAKSTPASNSSAVRKSSGGSTPTPAKKGQQSLKSFFTRKPKQ